MRKKHATVSRRKRAACLRNLRRAWKAPRRKAYELTPARLEACRANLGKAAEATHLRYKTTPRRRAASRANAVKAREANRQSFRFTEARRVASTRTIRQAQAAERPPESYARSRFNHLKHGLTVRTLEETLKQMGDDPKEYAAHCRRFERVFAPENPAEQKVVQVLAAVVWRRLRLFQAQVRWETDRLKYFFTHAPEVKPLDTELTRLRAHGLMSLLLDRQRLNLHDRLLTAAMERELRVLLRLRTGSDAQFKFFSHETSAEEKRIKELEREVRTYDRLASGDPEAWKVVEKIMPRWVRS